jgi:hypothetical protein
LTNPHGITSNEFIRTGLSKALDGFLTKLPALARPAEESKHDIEMEAPEITSGDAKSVMLRLKTFSHYMFLRTENKLPFNCLVQLNHDAVSQNENLIIDNDQSQRGNESINQLMKRVTINLVYDPDGKLRQ